MGGWMLAGIRRGPGPLIGTVVASAAAAILTVAAISTAAADTQAPAGRLASASVVVAGSTNLNVTLGSGQNASRRAFRCPPTEACPPRWRSAWTGYRARPRPTANPASRTARSGPVTWTWSR